MNFHRKSNKKYFHSSVEHIEDWGELWCVT